MNLSIKEKISILQNRLEEIKNDIRFKEKESE